MAEKLKPIHVSIETHDQIKAQTGSRKIKDYVQFLVDKDKTENKFSKEKIYDIVKENIKHIDDVVLCHDGYVQDILDETDFEMLIVYVSDDIPGLKYEKLEAVFKSIEDTTLDELQNEVWKTYVSSYIGSRRSK